MSEHDLEGRASRTAARLLLEAGLAPGATIRSLPRDLRAEEITLAAPRDSALGAAITLAREAFGGPVAIGSWRLACAGRVAVALGYGGGPEAIETVVWFVLDERERHRLVVWMVRAAVGADVTSTLSWDDLARGYSTRMALLSTQRYVSSANAAAGPSCSAR
jgi:hypothetical protein